MKINLYKLTCPLAAGLLVGLMAVTMESWSGQHASRVSSQTPPRLAISPASIDFSHNPQLLERLLAGPHGYFRFINTPFAQAVCTRFTDDLTLLPDVNLHGDAHLEQFAITDQGHGLTDYDAAAIGPMVIDLVRLGVSVYLASQANGWADHAVSFVTTFLRGYRDALENPKLESTPPSLVARVRDHFQSDRAHALANAESLMAPLTISPETFEQGKKWFVDMITAQHPELPTHFFATKRVGRFHAGIGSALNEKYLVRVEGPTSTPDDDIILEVKEVQNLRDIACIQTAKQERASRILTALARIARHPYPFLGYFVMPPHKDEPRHKQFWVHAWPDSYQELSIRQSFLTPEDLRAVAYDVGLQLGLGHPAEIADPHGAMLRHALLVSLEKVGPKLEITIRDFSQETIAAWQQFRADVRATRARP